MPTPESPPKPEVGKYTHFYWCGAILIVIALVGLKFPASASRSAWLIVMLGLGAFAVIAGHGITGQWRGILIDARCKISLSRLQLVAWSLLILSALLCAAMRNVYIGSPFPLEIDIPTQLWVLMGISTTSMIASPALLTKKAEKQPVESDVEQSVEALQALGVEDVSDEPVGVVVVNKDPSGARWGDLFRGEEVGNAATIDVGKLQMFFFTFVLVLSYAAALSAMFKSSGSLITELPAVQQGMNTLLGISHTGYLASKAIPHSREAPEAATPPKKKAAKKAKQKATDGGGA